MNPVSSSETAVALMNKYLNLGCGSRFHVAWTNVDLAPQAASVLAHNLREALPFSDETFDVVYHSHLLEHLPRDAALPFLGECQRVMKPGGVLRLVVPDLEQIVRLYLRALEAAVEDDRQWQTHYRWIMLELYDQTVRTRSGGDMARYLGDENIPNLQFVLNRMGGECRRIMEHARRPPNATDAAGKRRAGGPLRAMWREFRQAVQSPRQWLIRRLLGPDYEALQIGRFRLAGEVHQWMYDRYSLGELLRQVGFASPRQLRADESQIPNWNFYGLDLEPAGTVYKPDSLFMEAIKPTVAGAAGSTHKEVM